VSENEAPRPSGLPQALGAYVVWGFMPLYLLLVKQVPAFEFVGWRIVWTLPVCFLIVAFRGQFPAIREALRDVRAVLVREVEDRELAAAEMDRLGRPEEAGVLRAEALLTKRYLD